MTNLALGINFDVEKIITLKVGNEDVVELIAREVVANDRAHLQR